jgi:hypothetical protein
MKESARHFICMREERRAHTKLRASEGASMQPTIDAGRARVFGARAGQTCGARVRGLTVVPWHRDIACPDCAGDPLSARAKRARTASPVPPTAPAGRQHLRRPDTLLAGD